MRILNFVDTTNTDEAFVPSTRVTMMQTSAGAVNVYWGNSDDTADHKVVLTVATGNESAVATKLANAIASSNVGGASVLKVDSTFDALITGSEFSAGS